MSSNHFQKINLNTIYRDATPKEILIKEISNLEKKIDSTYNNIVINTASLEKQKKEAQSKIDELFAEQNILETKLSNYRELLNLIENPIKVLNTLPINSLSTQALNSFAPQDSFLSLNKDNLPYFNNLSDVLSIT